MTDEALQARLDKIMEDEPGIPDVSSHRRAIAAAIREAELAALAWCAGLVRGWGECAACRIEDQQCELPAVAAAIEAEVRSLGGAS